MPDALLTLLQWCLLALIYLFFFRVLQATWYGALAPTRRGTTRATDSSSTATAPRRRRASSSPVLVIVEPSEREGEQHPVGGELTIGRAAGCEVTLDDTFISQLHARIAPSDSGVVLEDLGSTNGTYLNRKRVTAPVVVAKGDRIQVGGTIMELR